MDAWSVVVPTIIGSGVSYAVAVTVMLTRERSFQRRAKLVPECVDVADVSDDAVWRAWVENAGLFRD